MIDLLAKLTGFGWVWDKLNGAKTYIAGATLMLSGAAAIATGVSAILTQFQAVSSLGGAIDWARGIESGDAWKMIQGGATSFGMGLAAIGLRHNQDKAAAAVLATIPQAPLAAGGNTAAALPAAPPNPSQGAKPNA